MRIYIDDRRKLEDNTYIFTAKSEKGTFDFTHSIRFPICSYLLCSVKKQQLVLYSENVQRNQLIRILAKHEKWRLASVLCLIGAMIMALIQTDKSVYTLTGLILSALFAITVFILIRSNNQSSYYKKEEGLGNIVHVPYELIHSSKNKSYIYYCNENNERVVAMLPTIWLKKCTNTIPYHIPSKSVILMSEKQLRIINRISLLIAVLFILVAMIVAIFMNLDNNIISDFYNMQ